MPREFDLQYALLNAEQRRAVDHVDGPMLVLAGAGTGKTQIIALRIAKLLATQDIEPRNILCLTFTESGVLAMRQRLIKILGPIGYQVHVYTFHGFCNEVITEHPEIFINQAALESVGDLDRMGIFQAIIEALPIDSPLKPFGAPDFYIPDLIRSIQTLKRENVSPDRLQQLVEAMPRDKSTEKQIPKQQELVTVYRRYQQTLRDLQQYDYEDMVLFAIQAFSDQPDLLADYQERYLYLLVDEFQDTNGAQNDIVRLLTTHHTTPNTFVVGDDRQSIFRFQGAALENILSFQQRYGQAAKLVNLQNNYRSQQTILDAAGAVIANNQHSLAKHIPALAGTLQAARDLPAQPITVAALSSIHVELHWLAQRIKALLAAGVSPVEIAVLVRKNSDGDLVLDALTQAGIPVHLVAGGNVLQDKIIQQLLQLFNYVAYSGSEENLFSILHYAWLDLPSAEVDRLLHQAKANGSAWLQLLQTSEQEKISQFMQRLLHWRELMHSQPATHWFTSIVQQSGWLEYVLQEQLPIEQLNRLNTVYHTIQQLVRHNPAASLRDMLDYFQLLQRYNISLEEEPLQTKWQAVQIMTAHKAKGLEFTHVFIFHAQDKRWGNVRSNAKLNLPEGILQIESGTAKEQSNEDERRLFYVAMTRAKEQLYISYAQLSETGKTVLPSQFVSEIPTTNWITAADVAVVEGEPLERLSVITKPLAPRKSDDQLRGYLQGQLADYRMSATHLNDYLECPRIFYYQDLLRVPRATTRAVGFGVAIHNVLRYASQQYLSNKVIPDVAELLEIFNADIAKLLLSTKDKADSQHFGKLVLQEYYAAQAEVLKKNVFPEKDFKPYHVVVAGVPLVGKIDAIQMVDETAQTVHVLDYKTGNPDNKSSQLAAGGPYHRQLLFYKLLCDNAKPFGFSAVSGEIHFVQSSKTKHKFVNRVYEFSQADVEQVTVDMTNVYKAIQSLDFLQPDPDKLCGECQWCILLG